MNTFTWTFLFTDIEGSTRLWEQEPVRMARALAQHDDLCRATITRYDGELVKFTGDGMCAVFEAAPAAVSAAIELQRVIRELARSSGVAL